MAAIKNTQAFYGAQYLLDRVGAGQRSYPKFRVEKTEQQHNDLIDSYIAEVRGIFEQYYREIKAVDGNVELSQEGRNRRYTPVQEKVNTAFNRICSKARQLQDQHLAKVEQAFQLPAEVVKGDASIRELRNQEIRRFLLDLPQVERIKLALSAIDPELLAALEGAPACMQIIPGDVLERARVLRVKRVRGQVLLGLEDERLALERINEILNGIANVLPWVTIQPNLWPLPESVFPLEDDIDPAESVEDPQAAQIAAGAKLAAAFMQQ